LGAMTTARQARLARRVTLPWSWGVARSSPA